jgi:hypothetical protein
MAVAALGTGRRLTLPGDGQALSGGPRAGKHPPPALGEAAATGRAAVASSNWAASHCCSMFHPPKVHLCVTHAAWIFCVSTVGQGQPLICRPGPLDVQTGRITRLCPALAAQL